MQDRHFVIRKCFGRYADRKSGARINGKNVFEVTLKQNGPDIVEANCTLVNDLITCVIMASVCSKNDQRRTANKLNLYTREKRESPY